MNVSRRVRAGCAGPVLVAGMVLAACSSDTGGGGEASPSSRPAVASTGPTSTSSAAEAELVLVDPTTTGEGVSAGFGDHAVARPVGDPRGELLVFFPGTGAEPDWYSAFLEHAAGRGYHVIGLAYPNDLSVNFDLCQASTDPACAESAREEVLWGIDAPGLPLDVTPADAAITRLTAALEHLGESRPDEGWDDYLDASGEPAWERIATAGHSQGGGHAAYLGRERELARVVLLDATEPSPWTNQPMLTPPDRMWGLAHAQEPIVAPIERSWDNLGLPGEVVDVDGGEAPWGGSHRLITSTDQCRGDPTSRGYHHNCPVVDEYLPDPMPAPLVDAWDQILTG